MADVFALRVACSIDLYRDSSIRVRDSNTGS
jgi:hypothetical protein